MRCRLAAAAVLLAAAAGCADDGPPRIVSTALVLPTGDAYGPYRVVANIADEARGVDARILYVATSTSSTVSADADAVAMAEVTAGTFEGALPAFPLGTVVSYVVEAKDHRGQIAVAPAFDAPHVFTVGNVPSRPELLTLWPNEGPATGMTEVILVGRDFRPGLVARFGANPASTIEVISRTQARVSTPAGDPGLVDVTVLNPDGGAATLEDAFTYFPTPEIFLVVPPSGPVTGGTFVEIFGARFQPGSTILFGGVPATGVTIVDEGFATARTPPHAAGFVTVRIEHPTRGFGERPDAFEYIPPPEVLAIDPARGPDLGGTFVTVTGRFFRPGARLAFDTIEATGVMVVSSTELVAVTPAHPVGFADVVVTNDDLQQGRLSDGFFFFGPPIVTEVVPPYAAVDGGAVVTIRGENFERGSTVTVTTADGRTFTVVCQLLSETELSCELPPSAAAGGAAVQVTNSDGRSDRLDDAFDYFSLVSVTPDRGPSAGGTAVVVRGRFLPQSVDIAFGGAPASCSWISPDEVRCTTPPGPLDQFVDVTALPSDPGQTPATLEDGYFYVAPPEITNVAPPDGPLRGGVLITISGRFFRPGSTVTIRGLPCQGIVVVNPNTITCTVPPGPPGFAEVRVTNPDGQFDADPNGFEYVPIVATPDWGLVDGNTNVVLTGRGFAPGASVRVGGLAPLDVVIVSDREVRLRTPRFPSNGGRAFVVDNPADPPETGPDLFSVRSFQETTTPSMGGIGEASDVIIGDFDNDGDGDFVFVNGAVGLPARSQVVENNGNGTYTATPIGSNDVSNEGNACDVNGDGLLDFTYGVSGGSSRVFVNNGGLNFSSPLLPTNPSDAFEASLHDISGDGVCDFLNLGISSENTLLINNGMGGWSVVANAIPHEGAFVHDHKFDVGDLDGDGDIDIVVVVDDVNFGNRPSQRHRIYLNDGTNHFTEDLRNRALLLSFNGDVYDVRIGDLDGDGDLDIVMPNFNRRPAVLMNDGTGLFTRVFDRIPDIARPDSAMVMTDIEGDGDPDLFMVSLDNGTDHALYLNDGRGFFLQATRGAPTNTGAAYRAAMGDIDGDGRTDIVQGTVNGPNRMWFALE